MSKTNERAPVFALGSCESNNRVSYELAAWGASVEDVGGAPSFPRRSIAVLLPPCVQERQSEIVWDTMGARGGSLPLSNDGPQLHAKDDCSFLRAVTTAFQFRQVRRRY